MGKGTNTTTQKNAPDPAAMQAYQDLINRANGVAGTPFQSYGGDLTAGVNAQQNLGIGNINSATQSGSPWFDYAATMAHPIAASDIQRYQDPYTQNVVDATQAQFDRTNQQQQENLSAKAISQGALGGSRANIAAADLGYQQRLGQAPVIAGLYDRSYTNALQAAQQQQQAGFQGAGVGANIQQANLQGAGAQIGAGTLQQQTEQARINALYQQYQLAQAFPYQQAQWLAGIDTGVGSQMGGTSTTTAPAPSVFGQIAGAGVAGLGLAGGLGWKPFAARGGRIDGVAPQQDYEAGGSVGSDPYGGVGFIPHMQIRGGSGAPHAPAAAQIPHASFDPKNFAFPRTAGVGPIQLNPYATTGAGVGDVNPTAPQAGLDPNGQNYYARGGVANYADGGSAFDPRGWGRPDPVPEGEGFWPGVGRDMARYAPSALRAGAARLTPTNSANPRLQIRGRFAGHTDDPRWAHPGVMNSPLVAAGVGASLMDWDQHGPDTFMDRWAHMGSPAGAGVGPVSDDVERPVHLPRGDSFEDRFGEMLPPQGRGQEIPDYLQAGVADVAPAARFDAPLPRRNPYARPIPLPRENPYRGYADGGPTFNDRWNGTADDDSPEPFAGVGSNNDDAPIDRSKLPRQFFDADEGPDGAPYANPPAPGNALGYAPSNDDSRPAPVAGVGAAPAARGFDWSSLSMPLMAAGLGMMASRSPHPGVAIGEGGLAGVQAYAEQQKQGAERALAEKKQALDARRLDQMAEQSREHLALQTRTQKFHEKQANRPYVQMTVAEEAKLKRERYTVLPGVTTADGHPVERDMQHPRQPLIDSVTRKEVTPEQMQSVVTGGWKPLTDKVTEEGNPVLYDKQGNLKDAVTGLPIQKDAKLHAAKEIQISGQSLEVRAHQRALGDVKGAYAGLPWGSGANIAKQQIDEMATTKLVNEGGMTPREAAEYMSAQTQAFNAKGVGLSAEARTAGTREANLKIILKATEGAIPAALEASREVTRYSGFVPLDKIIQKGQVAVNDEKMVKFGMANLQLAEHWARAMNPTGVMRESDRDMALHFLSTARNQPTYEAAVLQLKKQIDRELTAVKSIKDHGGAQAKLPGGDQAVTRGDVNKELGASAANPISDAERSAAMEWLKNNPNHASAPNVRKTLGQ